MSTDPVKLTWRRGTPAPVRIRGGAAVVHGNTAYFSQRHDVYSYTLSQGRWTKLRQCKYRSFSMAVINNQLTTIGGEPGGVVSFVRDVFGSVVPNAVTNILLCLPRNSSEMKWEEFLPPMPTPRRYSAAVTTPTHLIVAGGANFYDGVLSVVETLDTNTLQWSSVCSSPEALKYPNMTLCNGQLYLYKHSKISSCSVEELLKSHKPASINSSDMWTKLADILVPYYASLTTLRGQVLAIGGMDQHGTPTRVIHQYNRSTNSWSVIGEMPTPHVRPLIAVLPSHELIVVGGFGSTVTEIASSTY